MNQYKLNYLDQLESEAIHIIREAAVEAENPAMLYSIGKDSSVLLRLAEKAFYPARVSFPLLHIDTGYKFKEMIEFRDSCAKRKGLQLLVYKNEELKARKMSPEDAHTDTYIYYKKTKPLIEAIKKYKFDMLLGGARREEERSRAKERIFSLRDKSGSWNFRRQRPEFWHTYNTALGDGETIRVFPLSNWLEEDIWRYIQREDIKVVPLYFAQKRDLIRRNGVWLGVDEFVRPKKRERTINLWSRYRTLGCSPSTGAVLSRAKTVREILSELKKSKRSERETRAIDHGSENAMEVKKIEGYF